MRGQRGVVDRTNHEDDGQPKKTGKVAYDHDIAGKYGVEALRLAHRMGALLSETGKNHQAACCLR